MISTVAPTARRSRRDELLDAALEYFAGHSLVAMSLRPLADAIGSSTGVLRFLFGSKDGFVREVLSRVREDDLYLLQSLRGIDDRGRALQHIWQRLSDSSRRGRLVIWVEGYTYSLRCTHRSSPSFAQRTTLDWLAAIDDVLQPSSGGAPQAEIEATLFVAVVRGAILDLLATGDTAGVDQAFERYLVGFDERGSVGKAKDT